MICEKCKRARQTCFSGQAITSSECEVCGETIMNPTTWTNKICESCSVEYSLCEVCGDLMEV